MATPLPPSPFLAIPAQPAPAPRKRLTRVEIARVCKTHHPRPEHGPGQYSRVIKYLIDEEEMDLLSLSLDNAVKFVLQFMDLDVVR